MAYDKADSRLHLQEKLGAGDPSILAASISSEDDKRKGRRPKYPDPKPGYRSGYSVNRSFTQAEIILLKQILKEAGDPPVDMLTQRSWSQHDDDSRSDMQSSNGEHNVGDVKNEHDVMDATMIFPANEQNPKNRELLSQARRKRTRNVTTPYQTRVLRKVLSVTSFPSTEMREALANSLNMHPRTVQIWFQNQRQKAKNSPTNLTSAAGIPHLDNYGTSDIFPIPLAPNNNPGIFFHNMSMMSNNNAGTNVSTNVTSQPMSSSMSQQNLLPPSPPYTIVPIYQAPTPTYPSTIYLSSATLQFQNYSNGNTSYHSPPEVSPQVPQQGYNSQTGANGTAGQYVQNPTLDMLAAAALEAENGHPPQGSHSHVSRTHINGSHVSHHAHPHHQHQGRSPQGSSQQTRHPPPSIFTSKTSPIDASADAVSPLCTSPIVHGLRPW
ncbi:1471_t:CDS:2 [Paraglomus brasilianum]|uniref:1471_t:CDS:1 n=1 Tax=Paraglomus brasilianum TaxID=144538 RepID=A0A9N8YYR6_9GLOM|nr:1471_t:CDS:2 [Paraglomus brasilianum]